MISWKILTLFTKIKPHIVYSFDVEFRINLARHIDGKEDKKIEDDNNDDDNGYNNYLDWRLRLNNS